MRTVADEQRSEQPIQHSGLARRFKGVMVPVDQALGRMRIYSHLCHNKIESQLEDCSARHCLADRQKFLDRTELLLSAS